MPTADYSSYHQANGTTSDGSKFDNFIDAVQATVNGLDTNNLSPTAGITAGQLAAGVAVVPTGVTLEYCAAAAPTGFLLCDGASYLRATYAALFAIIGTTYGSADGTHFNVPDFRGRVAVGYAAAGGHTDVSTLGNNDGVAAANRRPKHQTSLAGPTQPRLDAGGGGATTVLVPQGARLDGGPIVSGLTVGTGVGTDAVDAPAYIVVNRIIKT